MNILMENMKMDCFDKTKLIKIRLIDEHFTILTTHAKCKCILNSNVERNQFFMCFFFSQFYLLSVCVPMFDVIIVKTRLMQFNNNGVEVVV